MKTFWTPYISDHTIRAICWTLIHSLWIGLVIALLAGLVITITRKSSATLRYNLLCGILILFTLSVWVTFWFEMGTSVIEQTPFRIGQVVLAPDNHLMIIPATTTPHLSLISRVIWFLNEYSNIIFLTWLLFFVLKSLKMAGGLLYIQRIRTYKVHEVADELKHKIETFTGQIGIRRIVHLVQSELVKVPVAVGWLKPVILLPMGIILQLSPEQLESILWHELAHIRRRDYLVNILQGLVETVFFFNPGLLWLSSLIRAEREACCDDIVLSRTNRKANYLEALLAFGNEDNSRMSLAMSIGSGNQVRDRLRRIINKENKRLNMAEKVVLIIGLVALSAFTELPQNTQRAVRHLVNVMIKTPGHADTSKSKTTSFDPQAKQIMAFGEKDVTNMDTTIHFRSVTFKRSDSDLANNDITAVSAITGKRYHLIVRDSRIVSMDINGEKISENDLPEYEYILKQIDDAVLAKREFRAHEGAYGKLLVERFKEDRNFDKRRSVDSIRSADMKAMNNIIADLVANKVVASAADVKWFALTNTEFMVNGQKQPDETQQRYKAKYGIHEGWGLYYGPVPFEGKGVFIDPKADINMKPYWGSVRSKFDAKTSEDEVNYSAKLEMLGRRMHEDSVNYADQKDRALNVIADLVHDKVLADPASIKWFGLSNTEFIVNGQKQPDEVQQRYKDKYGISPNNGLYYGPVQMHGTGVFIDADDSRPPLPPRPRQPKTQREPRSGYANPRYTDTILRKQERLLKQQSFAADQAKKREYIMQLQKRLPGDQRSNIQKFTKRYSDYDVVPLQKVMANITDDLVRANVLGDKSDLVKFNLTNSALIVNGKKQSEELHEKLKAKYLEQADYKFDSDLMADPNFGLHYNTQNGLMGLGITSGSDSP